MTNITYLSTANGNAPSLTSHIFQFLVTEGVSIQSVYAFTRTLPYWKDVPESEVIEATAKAIEALKKIKAVKTNNHAIYMAD